MKALLAAAALALAAGVAPAFAFDAGSPADVLTVLTGMGAAGSIKHAAGGLTVIEGMAVKTAFTVEFQDCEASGAGCRTVVYRTVWKVPKAPTLEQINGWNLGSTFCPAVVTREGFPGISYAVRTTPAETAADVKDQFDVYLSCLQGFSEFGPDPDGFLKKYGGPGDRPPDQPASPPAAPNR